MPVIVQSVRGYHKRSSPRLGNGGHCHQAALVRSCGTLSLAGVSHDSASPMPLLGASGVSGVSGVSGASGASGVSSVSSVSGVSLWFCFTFV